MRNRSASFRWAVVTSVIFHAALICGLIVFGERFTRPREIPAHPGLDTRVGSPIHLSFDTKLISIPTAVEPERPEPPHPMQPHQEIARTPTITHVTRPLQSELSKLLQRPTQPVGAEVVEVPITPTALNPDPVPNPGSPVAAVPSGAASAGPSASEMIPPIHGSLSPGQTIVYVLDRSGSMGEHGKFDRARRALIATLRGQPKAVRFQVVLYDTHAIVPSPAPVNGCVPATPDNVERTADMLLALKGPSGRSNHTEGLRTALELRPDIVLILTDAEELPTAILGGVTRQTGRSVRVCLARITTGAVLAPVELKW